MDNTKITNNKVKKTKNIIQYIRGQGKAEEL